MKLSDTQLVILTAAAQRSNLLALPLPQNLKGGAAQKVVASLLKQGLLEEIDADTRTGEPVWRKTGDGHGVTLAMTKQGLAAIGIEPENAHTAPSDATQPDTSPESGRAAKVRTRTRTESKQTKLIEMLRRPEGASIEEIVAAFGWQAHTVRGAIAGALKRKLGLDVTSEKIDGRGRVYRIV
jgi:hypothetical protein